MRSEIGQAALIAATPSAPGVPAARRARHGAVAHEPLELEAPYLEAVGEYAARGAVRFHVPGHKGGIGAPPRLA
ncbi:MAG: hypothetical protein ACRDLN_01985, partial [Solirubrobacteraceae bacterium]